MFKPFLVFNRINWKCCCIFKSFETIWSITCILYTYMIISNAFLWRTYYIINSAQIDWMLSVSVVTKDSHILIQLFKLFKLQSKKKKERKLPLQSWKQFNTMRKYNCSVSHLAKSIRWDGRKARIYIQKGVANSYNNIVE